MKRIYVIFADEDYELRRRRRESSAIHLHGEAARTWIRRLKQEKAEQDQRDRPRTSEN